ncbi:hypothetical protein ACFORJ_02740 [Corynebacterium hansenii]|uniref:Uncharacterized protein n=1 Tax=Corynebacterium hansenii TaxID=394964 RepID=A0ABV7ZLP4_9CORY|nr:hypothetical protein [Corynebacterium hansenii]WJY99085.1 hypothetical protein CHAN_02270 [Corynebacterium hansenii]
MPALRAVPDLSGLNREDTVAALRKSMAGLGVAVPESVGGVDEGYGPAGTAGDGGGRISAAHKGNSPDSSPSAPTPDGRVPVPAGLAGLLDGGLIKGAASSIDAAGAVVAGILAEVTAAGGHVALVGLPDFSPLGIVEQGGDLARVLDVPDPGDSPLEVVALLADGVDVVVVKLDRTPPPSAARPVMARLRGSGCALLHVGGEWPGSKVSVASRVTAIHGLGAGHGRIRGVEFHVTARGAGRPERGVRWAIGECPASEAAAEWGGADGVGGGVSGGMGAPDASNVAAFPLRRAE